MIGLTIKNLLVGDAALTALVPIADIYPIVMNEGTTAPAIVFTVDSLEPEYNKGAWSGDEAVFSVFSYAKSYSELQSIVSAVRTALELKQSGYSTQSINRIYLTGMDEGYILEADTFYNKLTFSVKINAY